MASSKYWYKEGLVAETAEQKRLSGKESKHFIT